MSIKNYSYHQKHIMLTISVVIITYNEERNIGRCLQSVRCAADEIVVVDSGSTDNTQAICHEYGAKFVRQAWLGYGAQKNFANTLSSCQYILSLDADEALSEELQQSIACIKQNPTAAAYSMNRLTNYCGRWIRHCGWYPDTKLRLWQSGCAQWSLDPVHEKLLLQPSASIAHLNGDLLHYTYSGMAKYIHLTNQYTTLAAENYYARRKKCSTVKIIFAPVWNFVRLFIFKCGFLDGYYGFVVCRIAAFYTFLKYIKLRQLYRERR
jgi:glycosyltransferase involved in cell wall biosynthesis